MAKMIFFIALIYFYPTNDLFQSTVFPVWMDVDLSSAFSALSTLESPEVLIQLSIDNRNKTSYDLVKTSYPSGFFFYNPTTAEFSNIR